jgi:hypothetical protein
MVEKWGVLNWSSFNNPNYSLSIKAEMKDE